jgi:hypothetical protein
MNYKDRTSQRDVKKLYKIFRKAFYHFVIKKRYVLGFISK